MKTLCEQNPCSGHYSRRSEPPSNPGRFRSDGGLTPRRSKLKVSQKDSESTAGKTAGVPPCDTQPTMGGIGPRPANAPVRHTLAHASIGLVSVGVTPCDLTLERQPPPPPSPGRSDRSRGPGEPRHSRRGRSGQPAAAKAQPQAAACRRGRARRGRHALARDRPISAAARNAWPRSTPMPSPRPEARSSSDLIASTGPSPRKSETQWPAPHRTCRVPWAPAPATRSSDDVGTRRHARSRPGDMASSGWGRRTEHRPTTESAPPWALHRPTPATPSGGRWRSGSYRSSSSRAARSSAPSRGLHSGSTDAPHS